MRQLFFLFGFFTLPILWEESGMSCFAQNQNLNRAISYYEDYERYNEQKSLPLAKAKIDSAAKNAATMNKHKTWFYRGQIYLALFDLALKNEMNRITESDINKKIVAAYQTISMAEADEALKSFQKEIELDDKKIYTNDANLKIKVIAGDYSDKAYSCMLNKNYPDALTFYEKSYELKLKMNATDTAAVNNMAISAMKIKDYKKVEQYYGKLIEMKYRLEKSYLAMIQMYYEAKDSVSAKATIMKGAAAVPDSYTLLIEQINLLLKDKKTEEAIISINLALAKKPNNHELHLALAGIYNMMAFPKDKNNNPTAKAANFNELALKAEEEYKKALDIKPDFQTNYSLGIYYNNWCADIINQLDNIKDPNKKKEEEKRADEILQKAIPLLEKAHELNPEDKDTIRTLRQLYVRIGQGGSDKYKKLDAELKGGK